jgi:hypothetical protein
MSDNLALWNALAKTDPKHTKPFNRAGGFKGTAIKPIWIVRQLTERFGPAGEGWGVNEPKFEVVHADGEILVYCTVSAWHGTRANVLYGVGGDKVMAKRQGSAFCDDEAFKKAFTDAVNNAFKFIGVGGDIHMGLFEDDKYVTEARAEFAAAEAPAEPLISDADHAEITTLAETAGVPLMEICKAAGVENLNQVPAAKVASIKRKLNLTLDRKVAEREQKEAA